MTITEIPNDTQDETKQKPHTAEPTERERQFDRMATAVENKDKLNDKQAREKTIEDLIVEELNLKHAVVHIDQYYILTQKSHPFLRGIIFVLESKQSFLNTYENQFVPEKESNSTPDAKKRPITKAQLWLKHPNRRQYQGITFNPSFDSCNKQGYYNIWKGFAVEAIQGKCTLFKEHIKEIICLGREDYFTYVWKWMAHIVQKPDKIATGLVLMGTQGTGKGIFAKSFGALFGPHFLHLDNIERIVGNFNFHMTNAVLVFGDEAIWGGNKKDVGKIKAMVTEEFALIEAKGKDIITVPNYRHFILSSNEDWPVHLDPDDRRFLVLKVSDKKKENFKYFEAIDKELKNGGLEALLHELQNEDISNFNLRQLPQNNEAFEVKLLGAPSTHQYIYYALDQGCFEIANENPCSKWEKSITTTSIYSDYSSWCSMQKIQQETQEKLGRSLKKLIPSHNKRRPRGQVGEKRQFTYEFPTLDKAREEFQKAYKVDSSIWD